MFNRRSISLAALVLATAASAAPVANAKPIDQDAWSKALEARSIAMQRAYQGRDLVANESASSSKESQSGLPAYPTPGDDRTFRADTTQAPADRYFRGADTTEQPKQPIPASHFRGADTTQQPKPEGRYFRGADTTQQPPGSSPNIQIVRREVASDSWNWDDAAIGAAVSFGLVILLGASAALVARRRTGPQVQ
jgi:hypothetical protein